jgi:hypothetical protein
MRPVATFRSFGGPCPPERERKLGREQERGARQRDEEEPEQLVQQHVVRPLQPLLSSHLCIPISGMQVSI